MVENVSSTTNTPPPPPQQPPNSCQPSFKFYLTTMSLDGNGVGPTNSTSSLPSDGLLQQHSIMGGPSNQDASTILKVSTAAASATDRHSVADFCGQQNNSSNSSNSNDRVNGDLGASSSNSSTNKLKESSLLLETGKNLASVNNFHGNPSLGADVSSLSLKKLYNNSECTPKSPSAGCSPSKSILESFLTRPSSVIQHSNVSATATPSESQPSATSMDEGSPPAKHRHHHHHHHHNHNHHVAPTTTSEMVDTRKVEPLKINIHREPIKTVIKVPQSTTPTKATNKLIIKPVESETPTPPSIPKLHIKNMSESSFVISDDDEPPVQPASETSSQPHVVPKMTIVRNPHTAQPVVTSTSAAANHFIVASSDSSRTDEGVIPKLTIKTNHQNSNHQDGGTNDPPQPTVPKLCLKNLPQLQPLQKSENPITSHHKDVRLTIKPIVEPPLPKILIKTNPASSNCVAHIEVVTDQVASAMSSSVESPLPSIPKLTIKTIPKPELPPMPHLTKVTIKPIVKPTMKDHDSGGGATGNLETALNTGDETVVKSPPPVMPILHKLNIKPIVEPAQPPQKETVPKLSIKLSDLASPKKQPPPSAIASKTTVVIADPDSSKETSPSSSSLLSASANRLSLSNSSLNSTSISSSGEDDAEATPRPVVIPKLTIKMVIADDKNPEETITETVVTPKVTLKPIPKPSVQQPLEIVTSRSASPAPLPAPQESGQDSPRIILKINKTVQESRSGNTRENITSELVTVLSQAPPPSVVMEKMSTVVEKSAVVKIAEKEVVEPKVAEQPQEHEPIRAPTPPMPKETPTASEILEETPQPVASVPPPEAVIAAPVQVEPESPILEAAQQTQTSIPVTHAKPLKTAPSPAPMLPNILRQPALKNRLTESSETPNNKRPAEAVTDLTIDSDEDVAQEAVAPKRAKRLEVDPVLSTQKPIPNLQSVSASTPAPTEPDERSMRTRRFKATALTPVVKNTPKAGKQAPVGPKSDDAKSGIVTRNKRNAKVDATPGGSTTTRSNLKKSENNNKATESTPQKRAKATTDVNVEQELLKQVTLAYGLTQQHVNNGTTTPPTFKDFENMIDASAQLEPTPVKKVGRGRPRKVIKPQIVAIEEDRDSTSSPMPAMVAADSKVSGRGKSKCDTPNSVIEILDDDEDEEVTAMEKVAKRAIGCGSMEVDPLAGTTPPPTCFTSKEDDTITIRTNLTTTPGRGRGGARSRGGRPPKPKIVEVMKNGKMVQIALERGDEDDSPSFSLWNRYGKKGGRGRGRGGPGRGGNGGAGRGGVISFGASRSRWGQTALLLQQQQQGLSPEKIAPESPFTSPMCSLSKDFLKRKPFLHDLSTPPFFEEDTRMSSSDVFQTPTRITYDSMHNEESQSSQSGFSGTTTESSRKRGKMEVNNKDGKTEFTIDMLAEYEWPPPNDERKSDVFMIQEQIAEYLGVKSFKRKYPDLVRRPVDMEERNYIMERGLASEKMCDLGLTALYASEILDIISNDYPDKYEEYKRYHREKFFRELSNRQRWKQMYEPVDRSQLQKDKAIESAAAWNAEFNKDRTENRRACMDLQTQIVQLPKTARNSGEPQPSTSSVGNYPVALVPGQFADYYKQYSPVELACYPINTALLDTKKLSGYLDAVKVQPEVLSSDDEDVDSNSSGSSSDSDTSTDSSSDDEADNNNCAVCSLPQNRNPNDKPERFIQCTTCQQKGHPSCIGMSTRMLDRVLEYKWQCASCKSCVKCRKKVHNDKMLFCDQCDRGYHIYCIGLRNVPEGRWHCSVCSICTRCGSRSAEGHPNPNLTLQQKQNLLMMAHWTHQYRTNTASKIKEHCQTLCILCAKQQNL